MTQANNVAIESSQINSSGVLQPAGGGTGLTTGNPLSSVTAPATNPATGTPSSSNYLRGDGTWATIAAQTYPGAGIANSTGTAWGTSYSTTGSGTVVALATSPTFVTPVLGTPTSGNFSTGTFTWPTFNQNTSGTAAGLSSTLAVGSGGTGVATLSGLAYGNGTSAFTAATAAQVVSVIGTTAVTNATNATTATNQSGGTVAATTGAFSGQVTFAGGSKIDAAGDVYARRSNGTTGVYYFADGGSKYLYYDGSNFNFSGGTVIAPSFSGAGTGLTGTASSLTAGNATTAGSATSATYLNSSNYISQHGSDGSWNADFQNTPAGTARYNGDVGANTSSNPGGTWWIQQNFRHTNSSNYWGTQVAWGWEDNANKLATRNVTSGTFGSWVYYLNSSNYTSYAPSLTGSGASGTWGINVTGSAGSANNGAKAWVNFNGGSGAINASYNVSSVTRNGSGDYTVNFSSAFASANYVTHVNASRQSTIGNQSGAFTYGTQSTTSTSVATTNGASNIQDNAAVYVACFGG